MLVTQQAVNLAAVSVEQLIKNMYAKEACGTRKEHIAYLLHISVFEALKIIFKQHIFNITVIIVAQIFKVILWSVLFAKLCKCGRSRVFKYISVCNLYTALIGKNNYPCYSQRAAAYIKEIIVGIDLVKLQNL